MPFLTVNGITLEVADGSFNQTTRQIGSQTAAYDGSLRKSRLTTKYDLQFETTPMTSADAYAWTQMLLGQGERWSFNTSLYGSKGTGPSSGAANGSISGTAKYGASAVIVSGGPVVFNCGIGSTYTVCVWRNVGGTWISYVIVSTGSKWVDGLRNDAAVSWSTYLTISPPNVSILNGPVTYDDLVVLPYAISNDWGSAYHSLGVEYPAVPAMTVSGDAIFEGRRTMMAESVESRLVQGYSSGWKDNLHVLSVSLQEV